MRIAIVCSSRYQLLNAINFACSRANENCMEEIDLFYSLPCLEDAQSIRSRIEDLGLFDDVILFCNPDYGLEKYNRKMKTLRLLLLGGYAFNKLVIKGSPEKTYDVAMIPCAALQFDLFLAQYRPKRIWLFDDGIGSYQGNIIDATLSPLRKRMANLRGVSFEAEALYVNNALMCSSLSSSCILQLPELNERKIDLLRFVFASGIDKEYRNDDWVYLELHEHGGGDSEHELKNMIRQAHPDTIFRPHPATLARSAADTPVQNSGLWELICYDSISGENVLIGSVSTSLLTPKLLFDREPFVILLYRLLDGGDDGRSVAGDKILSMLKTGYSDTSKVFVPESLEELSDTLDYLNGLRCVESASK